MAKRKIDPLEEGDDVAVMEGTPGVHLADTQPQVEWVTVKVPVLKDFDRMAHTPRKVTVGWLMRTQSNALRALLEGMQIENCRVQMKSAIGERGKAVDRWPHPFLYLLDEIAKQLP